MVNVPCGAGQRMRTSTVSGTVCTLGDTKVQTRIAMAVVDLLTGRAGIVTR